jgi:hypothetical protein
MNGGGDAAVILEFFNRNNIVAKVIGEHANAFASGSKLPIVTGGVQRVTAPPSQYPPTILMGSMTIVSNLVIGAPFDACFDVLFDSAGTMDATERTLSGAISTTLERDTIACN